MHLTIKNNDGPILGRLWGRRILRYFHYKGFDIIGIDFISAKKLRLADKSLKADTGDITSLILQIVHLSTYWLLAYITTCNLVDAISETRRFFKMVEKFVLHFVLTTFKRSDWLTDRHP